MRVILKRPRAKSDLVEIWDYIAEDSETQADAFLDRLDQKFRTLAQPFILGRSRDELAAGLRSFPVGRYVIFFRTLSNGVEIVRVLHGGRDLSAGFFDEDD
jgi:toxin ParE1/3/4